MRPLPLTLTLALLSVLSFATLTSAASDQPSSANPTARFAQPPILPADEPAPGTAIVNPHDGAIMVYVPSGYFIMGMDIAEAKKYGAALGYKDYHTMAAQEWAPARHVFVPGYFIDQYDVTNELWNTYTAAAKYKPKLAKGPKEALGGKMDLYPVVQVYWAEAQQYANWYHQQLPTEAQWEKAARGTDGRWFPWGNELPTPDRGVFVGPKNAITHYEMVGSRPAGASPYGCLDMAGNVYQWTSEWMEPYPNCPESESIIGYMGHTNGVVRGGSFYHADFAYCCAKRMGFKPDETYYHVGFRCVWEPPAGYFKSAAFEKARAAVPARRDALEKQRATGLKTPPGWVG